MVKCESLRIIMFRLTHTGKVSKFSRNSYSPDSQQLAHKQNVHILNFSVCFFNLRVRLDI